MDESEKGWTRMGYTASAKAEELEEKWYVVDARDRVLGRLAADIAMVLRGKHMPISRPMSTCRRTSSSSTPAMSG